MELTKYVIFASCSACSWKSREFSVPINDDKKKKRAAEKALKAAKEHDKKHNYNFTHTASYER